MSPAEADAAAGVIRCQCGAECDRCVARTHTNRGRVYFKCPSFTEFGDTDNKHRWAWEDQMTAFRDGGSGVVDSPVTGSQTKVKTVLAAAVKAERPGTKAERTLSFATESDSDSDSSESDSSDSSSSSSSSSDSSSDSSSASSTSASSSSDSNSDLT